jgi:hypothetical protein
VSRGCASKVWKAEKESLGNWGQNILETRKHILTKCAPHRTDNNEFNILGYGYFGLEISGKLVTLLTEAEIAKQWVMKMVLLYFSQSYAI